MMMVIIVMTIMTMIEDDEDDNTNDNKRNPNNPSVNGRVDNNRLTDRKASLGPEALPGEGGEGVKVQARRKIWYILMKPFRCSLETLELYLYINF